VDRRSVREGRRNRAYVEEESAPVTAPINVDKSPSPHLERVQFNGYHEGTALN